MFRFSIVDHTRQGSVNSRLEAMVMGLNADEADSMQQTKKVDISTFFIHLFRLD